MREAEHGTLRCRNSLCIQNHQGAVCPRCTKKDLESVRRDGETYVYTCAECLATWKSEA